jgi:CRP/FNR family transcriptional regulator, dissimilatory nitrate respiration regulator
MNSIDDSITDSLRRIFLFEALDGVRLEQIACCMDILEFARNEHLFHTGDQARYFYAILEGACKLYRVTSEGEEFVIHIQRAGDLVAEAAMFDIQRYPASCVAIENSRLLRFSAKGFVALLLDHPEIGIDLMHAYSRRLRSFVTALEDITLRDVKSRLARFMLDNSRLRDGRAHCTLPCSKKELSALLGTIPETLSRTLRDLKSAGAIDEDESGFLVLRPDLLREFVGE